MQIYPQENADTGDWDLMVRDGRMRPFPCGPRIFRAPPLPDVKFSYALEQEAIKACGVIAKYLEGVPARRQSKKEVREAGE